MGRKEISKQVTAIFEQIRRIDENGNEHWSARDFSKVLEYSEYRHFQPVIMRAKEACRNSGHSISDHFEDVLEMVKLGSGAERQVDSVKLSRYACYLIVQNGDPSKEVIALGQTYFAVQTRLQEIKRMEEYNALELEDENLDIKYKEEYPNRCLWEVPVNDAAYFVELISDSGISDITVYKVKNGNKTNCPAKSCKKVHNADLKSKTDIIFASLWKRK
jgi:hypothetical protein